MLALAGAGAHAFGQIGVGAWLSAYYVSPFFRRPLMLSAARRRLGRVVFLPVAVEVVAVNHGAA